MAPWYRPYAAAGGGGGGGGEEHGGGDLAAAARSKNKKCGGGVGVGVGRWVWGGEAAEMKRRRRVAGYKAYAVEGKVKASLRGGLRWIKANIIRSPHRT
jgi:hypothetical protein